MSDFPVITDEQFAAAVLQAEVPVLVDFYADWCGPCKALLPALVDIGREYEGEMQIVKVNVDDSPALRDRFSIRGIPAMLIFAGGQERKRLSGAIPRSAIAAAIDEVIEA